MWLARLFQGWSRAQQKGERNRSDWTCHVSYLVYLSTCAHALITYNTYSIFNQAYSVSPHTHTTLVQQWYIQGLGEGHRMTHGVVGVAPTSSPNQTLTCLTRGGLEGRGIDEMGPHPLPA